MRGYSCVGLYMPKNNLNVGSALRAVGVYGASLLVIQGARYKKASTDTRAEHKHTPLIQVNNLFDAVPFDCVPIAVDLIEGAKPLPKYNHPERAFYIFGPEDGTLGKKVIDKCRDVVYVPTNGCMNLAATVNVVLYDRMVKRG